MEEGSFICGRTELENESQGVSSRYKFGPLRGMRNSLALISSECKEGSVLWEAAVLLVLRLNYQVNSGGVEYVFLYFME